MFQDTMSNQTITISSILDNDYGDLIFFSKICHWPYHLYKTNVKWNRLIITTQTIKGGYSTFYPRIAYFVLYLKIINTFLKNNKTCIL